MATDVRGEPIDTVTTQHPKLGQVVATLYHVQDQPPYTKEHYHLEMVVGGKTHEYTMGSLAEGQARMTQLRSQA